MMWSAAAKVAGIVGVLRRAPAAPAAPQSVQSASLSGGVPAIVSANGGEVAAGDVPEATAQVPAREVKEPVGEPVAKAAAAESKNVIDKVYLSSTIITGCEDQLPADQTSGLPLLANSAETQFSVIGEALATHPVPKHAVQAFKLLSQSPALQNVVESIASDQNVRDAFMNNEALKDFIQSQNSSKDNPHLLCQPKSPSNRFSLLLNAVGGGAAMMRSTAAKVTGIVGMLRRTPAAPAAPQSVQSASCSGGVPAIVSAKGGEVAAGNVPQATAQVPAREVEELVGEPMARVVFGGMPSYEEAKAATAELKNVIDKVYLSSTNITGCEDQLPADQTSGLPVLANSVETQSSVIGEALATDPVPKHAVRAFKLLSQSPAVQNVVESIASDQNVWDAFMNNEALQDFIQSQNSRFTDDNIKCNVGEKTGEQAQSDKRMSQSSARQSQGKKQRKLSMAAKLATQIDRICSVIESRSYAASLEREFDPYKEIIETLKAIREIKQNQELYFFALDHFAEKKDNRQIFMNLDGDQEKLMWIKYKFARRNHY